MSMTSGQTTAPTSIRAGWYGVLHIARVSGPRKIQLGLRRREFVDHPIIQTVSWLIRQIDLVRHTTRLWCSWLRSEHAG